MTPAQRSRHIRRVTPPGIVRRRRVVEWLIVLAAAGAAVGGCAVWGWL